jgi:hypothetical protein
MLTTGDCRDSRVARDISGLEAHMKIWKSTRAEDPDQLYYNELFGAWRDAPPGPEKEKIAKKIATEFPERSVLIDGLSFTVRNPYSAAGERAGVSGERGFLDPSGTGANFQLLQAYLQPAGDLQELVVGNRVLEMMMLEALWHCGQSQGPDADPRCFPTRIVEELRELRELQTQDGAHKEAQRILGKSRVKRVYDYAAKLLEMAVKPAPTAGLAGVSGELLPGVSGEPLPGVSGEVTPIFCVSGDIIGDAASGTFCVSGTLIRVSGDRGPLPADGSGGLFCVSGGELLVSAVAGSTLKCIRGKGYLRPAAVAAVLHPPPARRPLRGLGARGADPPLLAPGLGFRRVIPPPV